MSGLTHWLKHRLCRCDEIECSRCTKPWVPLEKRPKKEIIEDCRELTEVNAELRQRLALLHQRLEQVRLAATGQLKKGDPS